MRNSAHYDEPVPQRRRRLISTDRMLAVGAFILAAVSLVLGLLN